NLDKKSQATMSVRDAVGRMVLQQQHLLSAGAQDIDLSVSHLSSGVYFLEVRAGEDVKRKSFVIQ
ncbi:MAG: T9SS type A sorting domain-containing protein, partial [Bacteroidota bacterium]